MGKLLWSQRHTLGPSERSAPAIAYDRARKQMVLFGGVSGESPQRAPDDTWEWNGQNWTQVADFGPGGRYWHTMSYDENRNTVVLFGGCMLDGIAKNDTWEWDGQYWTQVADMGPSPRFLHAMASDMTNKRIVLFGGETSSAVTLQDTWLWDGNQWVQHDGSGPPPRRGHGMGYDEARRKVVLFGGNSDDETNSEPSDTWEWDGTQWRRAAEFGPPPRMQISLCWGGGEAGEMVLFGGNNFSKGIFGDTWGWNGRRWVERRNFGPAPRFGHVMGYDSDRHRVMLFGGCNFYSPYFSDTWELFDHEPIPPPD